MRACVTVVLAMLLATPVPAVQVCQTTLANGLKLVAVEDNSSDLVGIHVAIKVSGRQEPEHLHGVRALIQHQISEVVRSQIAANPALGALDVALGRTGAPSLFNVEWDFVEASVCVPTVELPKALELLAEALYVAELPEEGLANAKADMLGQRDKATTGVEGAYYLLRAALLGRPTGLETIYGEPTTLANITSEQLRAFRAWHYVPANTCLCLVGPLSEQKAVAAVEGAFGALPRGEANDWEASGPAVPYSRARVGSGLGLGQAVMVVGVAAPPVTEPEFAAGLVAHQILSGPNGRIQRDLALARSLGLTLAGRVPGAPPPIDVLPVVVEAQPYVAIWSACDPRRVEKVRSRLVEHLQAFIEGGVSDEELETARMRAATELATQLHIAQTSAALINRCQMFGANPESIANLPEAVATVTEEQLRAMATRWFAFDYVGVQMPE